MSRTNTQHRAAKDAMTSGLRRIGAALRLLCASTAGVSTVEFAMSLPILISFGMYGTEIVYMQSVRMEISQIAMSVADNAARLGQTDNSGVTPTITEQDVDSVMEGAIKQGEAINLETNGRVILTSLEKDPFTELQFIHWQRCRGALARQSQYGDDGANNGLTGPVLAGLGKTGHLITAPDNSAVMFVEVYFKYHGLFGTMFTRDVVFKQEATFTVRDDRNLMASDEAGITGSGSQSSCS